MSETGGMENGYEYDDDIHPILNGIVKLGRLLNKFWILRYEILLLVMCIVFGWMCWFVTTH